MPSHNLRLRRIIAFWLDILIGYVPIFLYLIIIQIPLPNAISISLGVLVGIGFFVFFFLRDYLFRGRSLGKRLCKLAVVDADTHREPSGKKLILKNLCFFLLFLDALLLLFSGRSLGERVSNTTVIDTSSPAENQGIVSKQRIKVFLITLLCVAIPMSFLVGIPLSNVKQQKNYSVAYAYLVESDAFAAAQADESQIVLTGYGSGTIVNEDCEVTSPVDMFAFFVQGKPYKVVCHKAGDTWYVCNDCTDFR